MQERFGRYVLEELLGRGGMAEVFRARLDDGAFQKTVCIKRILPQLADTPGFADMLRDEASLAARLSHVNLVQALDFGDVDGRLFIAMELVEGTTLARAMKVLRDAGGKFPRCRALHIAVCMCRGLHAAHRTSANGKRLDLVHRDVSPQNVMLGRDGTVKLGDFGIARASERITKTQTGAIKGKPQYMAPEQARGEPVDHRVDQFATGVVLWEMLAGRALFHGRGVMQILDAVIKCEVPSLLELRDGIAPELDAVVHNALARDPAARFPDMAAFERALDGELTRLAATPKDIDLRPLVDHTLAAPSPDAEPTIDDDNPQLHATSSEGVWQRPQPIDAEALAATTTPDGTFAATPQPAAALDLATPAKSEPAQPRALAALELAARPPPLELAARPPEPPPLELAMPLRRPPESSPSPSPSLSASLSASSPEPRARTEQASGGRGVVVALGVVAVVMVALLAYVHGRHPPASTAQDVAAPGDRDGREAAAEGPRVDIGDAEIEGGGISVQQVRVELVFALPSLQDCYTEVLRAAPRAAGSVVVAFAVRPRFGVADLRVRDATTTTNPGALEACALEAIRRSSMPSPSDDVTTHVAVPFTFKNSRSSR